MNAKTAKTTNGVFNSSLSTSSFLFVVVTVDGSDAVVLKGAKYNETQIY